MQETGDVDGGKQQVAQLLLDRGGILRSQRLFELGGLALERIESSRDFRPIEAHPLGAVLYLGLPA